MTGETAFVEARLPIAPNFSLPNQHNDASHSRGIAKAVIPFGHTANISPELQGHLSYNL